MRRGLTLLLGLLLGCGPAVVESAEEKIEPPGGTTGTPDDDPTGVSPDPVGTTTSGPALPETSSSSGGGTGSSSTGCVDMGPTVEPDPEDPESRCLYDGLDCGCGYRCTIYVENEEDLAGPWGHSGCFPIDEEPVGLGEPCIHEDYPWSGRDNCPAGSMCEDRDRDGQGTCREFCDESDPDYQCAEPNAVPWVGCQECGCVCEVSCDPREDECGEGEGCYISGLGICAPDASGKGGAAGEPCEYINACDSGLSCVNADAVLDCPEGSAGCCTPYCDVDAPNCPDGTDCALFWEPGDAPAPNLEGLGVCLVPGSY